VDPTESVSELDGGAGTQARSLGRWLVNLALARSTTLGPGAVKKNTVVPRLRRTQKLCEASLPAFDRTT